MELRKRKTMERQFYCLGQILQQDDNSLTACSLFDGNIYGRYQPSFKWKITHATPKFLIENIIFILRLVTLIVRVPGIKVIQKVRVAVETNRLFRFQHEHARK